MERSVQGKLVVCQIPLQTMIWTYLISHVVSGCTTVEALEGATLHPAQVLKIEQKKGTLNYESDADLVFLDDNLSVHATFIAGKPVWLKKDGLVTNIMNLKYHMNNKNTKKHC